MPNRIWITWEYHRRSRSLSKALKCELEEVLYPDKTRIIRYVHCALSTCRLLWRTDARVIFAQNPSIVLALLVVIYGRFSGKKSVIDCHNSGLFPADGTYPILNWIAARIPRQSTLTIVTNERLSQRVRQLGGRSFVLPDPIPQFDPEVRVNLEGTFKLFFVCTFANDEPFLQVFEAAKLLGSDFRIYVSGDYHKKTDVRPETLANNVHLTGYLSNKDYMATLNGCDAVIDLTYRKDCLVCGAYEAIAAEKPLLLSLDSTAQLLFNKGALFTDNSAIDISRKIKRLRRDCESLSHDIRRLKAAMVAAEQPLYSSLIDLLSTLDT